jgi:hypothetical protein
MQFGSQIDRSTIDALIWMVQREITTSDRYTSAEARARLDALLQAQAPKGGCAKLFDPRLDPLGLLDPWTLGIARGLSLPEKQQEILTATRMERDAAEQIAQVAQRVDEGALDQALAMLQTARAMYVRLGMLGAQRRVEIVNRLLTSQLNRTRSARKPATAPMSWTQLKLGQNLDDASRERLLLLNLLFLWSDPARLEAQLATSGLCEP